MQASCAVFNTRGDALATADSRGNVYIFRLTKNRYERLQSIGTSVTSMCFSTLRKSELFVASRDGKIRCFDIDSRRLLKTLTGHRHAVNSISFHPFKALMTTSSVESLSVWDLKQWKKVRTLGAGSGVVTSSFTPDGKLLLIAFRDDTVLGWSTDSFENTIRFTVPRRLETLNILSLSVSSNGRFLVAGGKKRDLMVWNMSDQMPLRSVEMPSSVTQLLNVSFLPDSTMISVLADDGQVRFIDIDGSTSEGDEGDEGAGGAGGAGGARAVEHTIARRDGQILDIVFDMNAKFAACCVSDGSLLLYDLEIAREYTKKVKETRIKMGSVENETCVMLDTIEGKEKLDEKAPRRSPPRRSSNMGSHNGGGEVVDVSNNTATSKPIMTKTNINTDTNFESKIEHAAYSTKEGEAGEEGKQQQYQHNEQNQEQSHASQQSHASHAAPRAPQKDAAYWLQQSMPPPSRSMPTSELLEEAFGTKISSHSTDILRKQRNIERQKRIESGMNSLSPSIRRPFGTANNNMMVGNSNRLSRPRLAKLLRTYGRFPSKYRLTVSIQSDAVSKCSL